MTTRSPAERLDEAIDRLLAGQRPAVEDELRPLLAAARLIAAALRPVPASRRFEARLGTRLAEAGSRRRAIDALGGLGRLELPGPGWLLAAGAVSSAAVGVGVTAYAVWRTSRRHPAPVHRLLHR